MKRDDDKTMPLFGTTKPPTQSALDMKVAQTSKKEIVRSRVMSLFGELKRIIRTKGDK